MLYRALGRLGWKVSEIGIGTAGIFKWYDSDVNESIKAIHTAIESGCNFIDTAWEYGKGKTEIILSKILKTYKDKTLYISSKIPPKNMQWPSKSYFKLDDVFPLEHVIEYTEKSLKNLDLDTIDLMQFHVWEDSWALDERWQKVVENLKRSGKIQAIGISINRWEPENGIKTLNTGLLDTIQVSYNIFDQSPEDKLFPVCDKLNIGVIVRCPFDEGSLTGKLSKESKWPEGDFRKIYFGPENLNPSIERAEALKKIIPKNTTLSEIALRFVLANKTVKTIIPGMRKIEHVISNIRVSDGNDLSLDLVQKLKKYRWDRVPTEWSM